MFTTNTDIQFFTLLRQKLGENETGALAAYIDAKEKANNEANLKTFAIKEDIHAVRTEIKNLEVKLEVKIAETKNDIIRWVFGFFFVLSMMIFGLYLKK